MMLTMNVCVAIYPRATKASSILHVERDNAIRVTIQGERERRYRLTPLTAISGPSHAAEWMERCGEEAIDSVVRGRNVLILSTGQVGLSKRVTMFNRQGGIVRRFLEKLWRTFDEQKCDVACRMTLWEIRDGEILDLLRPTGSPFTSSLFCHSVPLATMEDIAVLLKGALIDTSSAECLSHLFLKLTVERNDRLLKSSVCFVDVADTPFLKRHAFSLFSHSLASAPCCAMDGSSKGIADLLQVSRMIASMAKRGHPPPVISPCSRKNSTVIQECMKLRVMWDLSSNSKAFWRLRCESVWLTVRLTPCVLCRIGQKTRSILFTRFGWVPRYLASELERRRMTCSRNHPRTLLVET